MDGREADRPRHRLRPRLAATAVACLLGGACLPPEWVLPEGEFAHSEPEGPTPSQAEAPAKSAASRPGHEGTRIPPPAWAWRLPESPSTRSSSVAGPYMYRPRQLIFEGKRSGEGYFSADGSKLVFQSERDPDHPFYIIYEMDLATGRVRQISRPLGKATCAWPLPDGSGYLFASTQADPEAPEKADEERELRESGQKRRYAWDYDPTYDLYVTDRRGRRVRPLTLTRGYDAEGSLSPDGRWVVFASNRRAYSGELSDAERPLFEEDPASAIDIYRLDLSKRDAPERLTEHVGYDGGPFFSPDGERITWRRFSKDGLTAEIWTMNADGSDQRPITSLGAMSWAPYYHPSGAYIIFTTNLHGFDNFELYLVDVEGRGAPLRVTDARGFDGLPVFSPDGQTLSWTSNRGGGGAQIYLADWDHAAALAALSGAAEPPEPQLSEPKLPVSKARIRSDLFALAGPEMEGRLTGTAGERRATEHVARAFEAAGLEPAGTEGWFEPFDFVSGAELQPGNALVVGAEDALEVGRDYRPLAFSSTGTVGPAAVAFAGYGIVAPEEGEHAEYDAYAHLDVEGKWALVFRFAPEDASDAVARHLSRFGSLRYKAMEARDHGAVGLLVVSGPRSKVEDELVPLHFDAAVSGTGIPAISISDAAAQKILGARSLEALQRQWDDGQMHAGFVAEGPRVSARVALELRHSTGRNVVGRVRFAETSTLAAPVVVGAHVDHLGRGEQGDSLARADEKGAIHFGADDNASGVAALLELARQLSSRARAGTLSRAARDVVLVAWSGEELGLYGASKFVERRTRDDHPLSASVFAYLNMDMIGRLREHLVLQGVGSSPDWLRYIEFARVGTKLPVRIDTDTYLPTDATPFYLGGVPILNAFTGAHAEYHSPRDTPDRIELDGVAKIAALMLGISTRLVQTPRALRYEKVKPPEQSSRGRVGRAYLGTIPDYAQSSGGENAGVALSGAMAGSPAEAAGIVAGDVLVELDGHEIGNIYDFVRALDKLEVGTPVKMVIEREGEKNTLEVTPGSRS